jgi:hypothetical protein
MILFEFTDVPSWSELARPCGEAERALGQLAHALHVTRLHPTWLWREITRTAVTIAQTSDYQVGIDQLRMALTAHRSTLATTPPTSPPLSRFFSVQRHFFG